MNDVVKIYQVDPFNLIMQFDTQFHQPVYGRYTVGSDANNIIITLNPPYLYKGKLTLDDFYFSVTAQRLLMHIIEIYALQQKPQIDFSIKDYMQRCELGDRKHIRKQLERDLFALSAVCFEHRGRRYYLCSKSEMVRPNISDD